MQFNNELYSDVRALNEYPENTGNVIIVNHDYVSKYLVLYYNLAKNKTPLLAKLFMVRLYLK